MGWLGCVMNVFFFQAEGGIRDPLLSRGLGYMYKRQTQVTTQISEFVTSKPSEQWQESYISYMNGMKKFNEYILETKVLANQIENGSVDTEILEIVDKIESIKAESMEYIKKSNDLRP